VLLLTHHIRKTIAERGFVEVEGAQIRLDWRVPTEEEITPLEERVEQWANQSGWSCLHHSEEDIYVFRKNLHGQKPAT
jgi:hypothetical protein